MQPQPHDALCIHYALRVIVACSLLHTFLPPWDFLDSFPTAQKYYKVFVYVVGYVALNGRSTIYQQISISKQLPSQSTSGGSGGGTTA